MPKDLSRGFPAINLIPDRDRIRGSRRPVVRARFWVALAASVALLIAAMGFQLMEALVVQR